ncbi:MAG: type II secretion system protein [Candidatus Brennerbacteria bacterium]|nr:type II secretion system protein [Candidatus Brennerbacteria bacterium]
MVKNFAGKINKFSGFTMLEMFVTIGIMSFIAAALVVYSHTGEKQIILFKEQARVLNVLARARNLGITSFIKAGATGPLPCGYGAHFEAPRTMIIFEDRASDSGCADADFRYSGPAEIFESSTLDRDISFDFLSLSDIVFVPPQPVIFITPEQDQAVITLTTGGNDPVTVSVTVSTANQISVQ